MGYHCVNSTPIKESIWESINQSIIEDCGHVVTSNSDGSHRSGKDMESSILGSISNKTAKYINNKKFFKMSSYRLSSVCSDGNHGDVDSIIAEINRRKNFDVYSILVRDDTSCDYICYDWYIIPSDFVLLDPETYKWTQRSGTKNKDVIIGWETDVVNGCSMSVTFSMSSQLWINVSVSSICQFLNSSCRVRRGKVMNYRELYRATRSEPQDAC